MDTTFFIDEPENNNVNVVNNTVDSVVTDFVDVGEGVEPVLLDADETSALGASKWYTLIGGKSTKKWYQRIRWELILFTIITCDVLQVTWSVFTRHALIRKPVGTNIACVFFNRIWVINYGVGVKCCCS